MFDDDIAELNDRLEELESAFNVTLS